jgi:hypothetical protein
MTFRQCSINSLGTPGISAGFHANISLLALRKLTGMLSYLSSSPSLIRAVLDGSPSYSWMNFMPMSLVLSFTVDWLDFLVRITISDWESCCVATKTLAEGSAMSVVEAYSIASWSQSYDFFKLPGKVSTPILPGILRST